MQGGAILSANYVPRDKNGNLLASYSKMGLGTQTNLLGNNALSRTANAPDLSKDPTGVQRFPYAYVGREFGIGSDFGATDPTGKDLSKAFFVNTNNNNDSGFLAGLRTGAGLNNNNMRPTDQSALDKTAFAAVAVSSRDDSSANHFDVSGLVVRAGMAGQFLGNLSSPTFGQQPSLLPPTPPVPISRFDDILAALRPAGALYALAADDVTRRARLKAVFKLIQNLSQTQASEFMSLGLNKADKVSDQIGVANTKNLALQGNPTPGMDPRVPVPKDPTDPASTTTVDLSKIWGITPASSTSSSDVVFASLAYAAIGGNSKCVRINMGGYDYHNNNRPVSDAKDLDAGEVIGRILATAEALGKPCFVCVTSDGSVESADTATTGTVGFRSDRGDAGMAFIFAYDPAGRPALVNPAAGADGITGYGLPHQIGWFTDRQAAVLTDFVGGWNDEKAAAAIFANYMAFAKKWAIYEAVMQPFNQGTTGKYFLETRTGGLPSELEMILKFQKPIT